MRPLKPKHYKLCMSLLVVSAIGAFFISPIVGNIWPDYKLEATVLFFGGYALLISWKRKFKYYESEQKKYAIKVRLEKDLIAEKIENERILHSEVNKNIEKYIEEKRIKNKNTRWWKVLT